VTILNIPAAFLGCPLQEPHYMRLPAGEWLDPHGQACLIVKLNETLYGIKQANREYFEEVFDYIVDELCLKSSISAPGLFFGGKLSNSHGILVLVYIDDIMIISSSARVASISSQLYDRFKARGLVPVSHTFQYLGMMVTQDRQRMSIAIHQIGYMKEYSTAWR
jgi:hypothetical protein